VTIGFEKEHGRFLGGTASGSLSAVMLLEELNANRRGGGAVGTHRLGWRESIRPGMKIARACYEDAWRANADS